MSIQVEKLTDSDIRRFKREIEGYNKSKKIFLILGFVFMALTILLLLGAVLFGIFTWLAGSKVSDYFSYEIFGLMFSLTITTASFASTFFLVTIIMFILRAVLFQKKTENRLNAIEDYEEYQKKIQEYPELAVQPQPQLEVKPPKPSELPVDENGFEIPPESK